MTNQVKKVNQSQLSRTTEKGVRRRCSRFVFLSIKRILGRSRQQVEEKDYVRPTRDLGDMSTLRLCREIVTKSLRAMETRHDLVHQGFSWQKEKEPMKLQYYFVQKISRGLFFHLYSRFKKLPRSPRIDFYVKDGNLNQLLNRPISKKIVGITSFLTVLI